MMRQEKTIIKGKIAQAKSDIGVVCKQTAQLDVDNADINLEL